VLGEDGCIYAAPCSAQRVLKVNCARDAVEFIGPELPEGPWKFCSLVAGPDGCLYAPPCTSGRALRVDCAAGRVELFGPDFGDQPHKWDCAILGPDGRIYAPPSNAGQVLRIDCQTLDVRLVGPELTGGLKYCCGALALDGNIYCPPNNAGRVLKIHSSVGVRAATRGAELVGPEIYSAGGACYVGAQLGPDGCVYSPPYNAGRVLRIDGARSAVDFIGEETKPLWQKWHSFALGADGHLYAPPCNASQVMRVDCGTGAVDFVGPQFPEFPAGQQKWRTTIVAPDGCLYGVPCHERRVLRISCGPGRGEALGAAADVGLVGPELNEDQSKFRGAALGPKGSSVFFVPYNAGQLLRVALPGCDDVVLVGDEPPRPPEPEDDDDESD